MGFHPGCKFLPFSFYTKTDETSALLRMYLRVVFFRDLGIVKMSYFKTGVQLCPYLASSRSDLFPLWPYYLGKPYSSVIQLFKSIVMGIRNYLFIL